MKMDLSIKQPPDRHQAAADVGVTAQVFVQLIAAVHDDAQLSDLAATVKLAGRTTKCSVPVQDELFDI
ncbi:hypothetical protein OIE66_17800 [Nonomuraea sp. NBC_01738]|uniref:hypothetical protein n=1 Tax=Nonomuraea sp. NBC_01738 TaxID=2976003 RepID=UPI002E0FBAFD|nr:hypothetical protein OIE66_17800 [Nonomuraea sp. NBC_01738]